MNPFSYIYVYTNSTSTINALRFSAEMLGQSFYFLLVATIVYLHGLIGPIVPANDLLVEFLNLDGPHFELVF